MTVLFDAAGWPRSPATMPGSHAGRPPRNKGIHYPADPPTVDEIAAVMRHTTDARHGWRLRAMIVVLWRAGLRVQEALASAGVRRRFAPHQLRHAHALELAGVGITSRSPAYPPHQPRHYQHLSAGDRPGGDHHGGACSSRADDVRQRRTAALNAHSAGAPCGAPAPSWEAVAQMPAEAAEGSRFGRI